jgi:hypothetical protein
VGYLSGRCRQLGGQFLQPFTRSAKPQSLDDRFNIKINRYFYLVYLFFLLVFQDRFSTDK